MRMSPIQEYFTVSSVHHQEIAALYTVQAANFRNRGLLLVACKAQELAAHHYAVARGELIMSKWRNEESQP